MLPNRTLLEVKIVTDHFLSNTDTFLGFEIRQKLHSELKSEKDNSKWLYVIYKRNGIIQYTKASHNNNQRISLSLGSYFTEEGNQYRGMAK